MKPYFDSHREIPWDHIIRTADEEIDVMVYFWNKWVEEYKDALSVFFQNPTARFRLILADDQKPKIRDEIVRLFPGNTDASIQDKIAKTISHLKALETVPGQVEVYKIPHLLNYSMQCVDQKKLYLSCFEMNRKVPVESPAFFIDLEKNPNAKKFYEKEWKISLKH